MATIILVDKKYKIDKFIEGSVRRTDYAVAIRATGQSL